MLFPDHPEIKQNSIECVFALAWASAENFPGGGKKFYFYLRDSKNFPGGGKLCFNNFLFHKTGKKMSKFPHKVLKKL
jgi:hypothetical protein